MRLCEANEPQSEEKLPVVRLVPEEGNHAIRADSTPPPD
jgi:hypothetical protein